MVLIFGISCKEEKVEVLIPNEKTVDILVDLHIAEAAILSANKAQKDSIGGLYYAQIFEMHEIKDSIFYQNLDMISKDPERTQEIYQKVLDKIEQIDLEGKTETEKIEDKIKKDSIGTKKK